MCNQLLNDRNEEADRAPPDEASLISEASGSERNGEGGLVVLPNGVPLHRRHWVRRTSITAPSASDRVISGYYLFDWSRVKALLRSRP
jgi:hypothetical protein